MSLSRGLIVHILAALMLFISVSPAAAATAKDPRGKPNAILLVTGLEGGSGSAIDPDGALYVAEPVGGQIARVDPRTGEVTMFASGLPKQLAFLGLGGVMEVAFIGDTASALVTLVASDWVGTDIVGIYRVDGPDSSTIVADIGALVKVKKDRTFAIIVDELNQPTSFEFIGNLAYVVSLTGEVWKIDNVWAPADDDDD